MERTERHIPEHECDSRGLLESGLQYSLHLWLCFELALFHVSNLEEAAVLGAVGGAVGALSKGDEGVAEGSAPTGVDSCSERGGNVAGEGSCAGVACPAS